MAYTSTVFSQLLKHLPRSTFQKSVAQYQGDKRCRTVFCWDLFIALLFGQLSQAKSLRDLIEKLDSQQSHHYHLGINPIKRSSLSDACQSRPIEVFYHLFFTLLDRLEQNRGERSVRQAVMLMDSTTISLCQSQYQWAEFRTGKGGIKIHTLYDPDADTPVFFEITKGKVNDSKGVKDWPVLSGSLYVMDRAYNGASYLKNLLDQESDFVVRMKKNMSYQVIHSLPVSDEGILEDQWVKVTLSTNKALEGVMLRRVRFWREEDQKELVFLTSDFSRSAAEIAELYKRRWKIELFFKWIKQNLKITRFYGQSANAVYLQVLIGMITYVLLRLIQEVKGINLTLQQITRRLFIAILQRRCLWELLSDPPAIEPEEEKQASFKF